SVARCRGSDGGMKSNGSLDSKRNIRASVSVCLCSYRNLCSHRNGNSENSEEHESSHECCTRQPRCPHSVESILIGYECLQGFALVPLTSCHSSYCFLRVARSLN